MYKENWTYKRRQEQNPGLSTHFTAISSMAVVAIGAQFGAKVVVADSLREEATCGVGFYINNF